MTKQELMDRIEVARVAPGVAHLILTRGPYPVCKLCEGKDAPIVNGEHLNPLRWCRPATARAGRQTGELECI